MPVMKPRLPMPIPIRFWIGTVLVAVFWTLNWSLEGLRTHWGFFPLWLGYILVVDGAAQRWSGSSAFARSPRGFVGLFVVSAPSWWLFELLNMRTQNWSYLGRESFSDIEYALLATLSFSTVIPAIVCTRDLLSGLWGSRTSDGPRLADSRALRILLLAMGLLMLALLLAFPRVCYPFLWSSVYCLLESFNLMRSNRSLIDSTAQGDWRPVILFGLSALVCGFFWELWNFYSYPKWVYDVPHVGFAKLFEMPALGYVGYIPFAWEIHALLSLALGVTRSKALGLALGLAPEPSG